MSVEDGGRRERQMEILVSRHQTTSSCYSDLQIKTVFYFGHILQLGSRSTLRARRSSSLLTVWSNCLFLVDFESHASSGSNRSNERWKIVPPAIHNVAERYIHTRYNFTTILDFSVGGSAIYDDKYEAY